MVLPRVAHRLLERMAARAVLRRPSPHTIVWSGASVNRAGCHVQCQGGGPTPAGPLMTTTFGHAERRRTEAGALA